jgi:hypothetical protein
MTEEAKCDCQRCGNPIAFPLDLHNSEVQCPHCHKATTLSVPSASARVHKATAPVFDERRQGLIRQSTMISSYALAFLIPIAGFFAGIYLMAKKETGHGVAVMAISVIWAVVLTAIIVSS